jgi:4,5-dihydroxyphthalate decarboxylase
MEMASLRLSLACGEYDRTSALIDGRVAPAGIELGVVPLSDAFDRHDRMLRHEEFDVCELSLSSFLSARSRGRALVAIPVFPYRMFRQQFVLVNRGAGITRPEDLRGRRVGVAMYQVTTALWVRGFLQHDFGIGPGDVAWVTDREELVAVAPPGVSLQVCDPERTLEDMLLAGDLDALVLIETVPGDLLASPRVARLFPDYAAVERDYFRRTGIFPAMHAVVIRESILRRDPWVAMSLFHAFEASRALAEERNRYPRVVGLAWAARYFEDERVLFGGDPYAGGLRANRAMVDALCLYAWEQGLTPRRLAPEDLFAATTLDT